MPFTKSITKIALSLGYSWASKRPVPQIYTLPYLRTIYTFKNPKKVQFTQIQMPVFDNVAGFNANLSVLKLTALKHNSSNKGWQQGRTNLYCL